MNPLVIHQFLKAQSLRRTKTDKADSLTIANYLMSVPYKPNSDILYNIFTLKSLCRSREQLIKERSKYQVLLTNQLDLTFPELKSFLDNWISTTLLFSSGGFISRIYSHIIHNLSTNTDSYHKEKQKSNKQE